MMHSSTLILLSLALISCQTTPASQSTPQSVSQSQRRTDQRNQIEPQEKYLAVHQSPEDRSKYEATGYNYAIATQGQAATQAVKEIFAKGGNMIDAAVAASFTISVERPQSTGLGGGGFMLYREGKSGRIFAIDFRERAPLKATENMLLDEKGNVVEARSRDGILSAVVPGLVAGLLEIHQKFGHLKRKDVMAPAIRLAKEGFKVYPHLANALKSQQDVMTAYPSSKEIFFKKDGKPFEVGDTLVQSDLAKSLQKISDLGASVFYKGELAKAIADEFKRQNGLVTMEDLAQYKVKWRKHLAEGNYKGFRIYSMPPPSSGGTHVVEILNVLQDDDLKKIGLGSADALHLSASAMQQSFADRAKFMGDPDFVKGIPLKGLTSKGYAKSIRNKIDLEKAKNAAEVQAGNPNTFESTETTNFSMINRAGNVVVSTQTINGWFGSGIVVPGTGIVLNNELDDFSAKPGALNSWNAVGGASNSIAPKKTPLSSMAPTIVMKGRQPIMALGAAGGTRIITCVAQTMLNYLEYKIPLYDSIAAIRYHHQWQPDQLDIEAPGYGPQNELDLKKKGYKINTGVVPCRANAVSAENTVGAKSNNSLVLRAVADPRDLGAAYAE